MTASGREGSYPTLTSFYLIGYTQLVESPFIESVDIVKSFRLIFYFSCSFSNFLKYTTKTMYNDHV